MTEKDREIRSVFLGRTVLMEDGRLSVPPPDQFLLPSGVADGASAVRLFGVAKRSRKLVTSLPEAEVMEIVRKALKNIGRGLVLSHQPESVACLFRYIFTRPAILVCGYEEGAPVVTAYAGRGLTCPLAISRALRTFKRHMPESITME